MRHEYRRWLRALLCASIATWAVPSTGSADAESDWQPQCLPLLQKARARWVEQHPRFKRAKASLAHDVVSFEYKRGGVVEYTASVEPMGTRKDEGWLGAYGGDSMPSFSEQRLAKNKLAALVVYDDDDALIEEFVRAFRPVLDSCVDLAALPPGQAKRAR